MSEATGWDVVPPTVLRDGPFGPGMCQLWIDADADADLVDVVAPAAVPAGWLHVLDALRRPTASRSSLGARRRPAAAPDGGPRRRASTTPTARAATCCRGPDGGVHGVDHGVTFHAEPKLRTVLWGWAG